MANIIRRAAHRLNVGIERYLPHSFIFVVVLTVVAYLLALGLTPTDPFDIVLEWYGQFWAFLQFAMQMTLIIVTGYGIATSPIVRRGLLRLAEVPSTPARAYLSVVLVGAGLAYINWGLGFVTAAFYAIALGALRDDLDYGYLVATAYIGIWPGVAGSLSITAPLLVNTPGHFLEDQIGLIPLTETIWSPLHLSLVIGSLIFTLLLIYLMRPPAETTETIEEEELEELLPRYDESSENPNAIAERLNNNPIFVAAIVLLAGSYIMYLVVFEGFIQALGLNSMNFILLTVGILLHGNVVNYANAVGDGATRAGQVILQFPFYGGIQGILIGTGLAVLAVEAIVDIATSTTYPALVFLITGILNIFVPSAGGQYIVMGEILHNAAATLGVADPVIITAYTFGDVWTNMLQPFWALPLLGIVGLRVRDVWGYVMTALVVFGIVALSITLLFPLLGLV
ncbi:MAG: TIGR00366 family protein [Natronomonas sp.]